MTMLLDLTLTCDIERVSADGSRTTVISGLACSPPLPADKFAKERAGQATEARLWQVFTAVPGTAIRPGLRLMVSGQDYGVTAVTPWPAVAPEFYEVLVNA